MKIDFSECELIENEMHYHTYNDFCKNCYIIKYHFKKMTKNGRQFYLYYVYANIHMNETFKNAIWDFLNSDDKEYYTHLIELQKRYKPY